jgi:xylulokinase
LEAVAYLLKRNLELVEGLGVAVSEVRSLGGAARSPLWLQIKADVLQKPVATVETEEVACLGATLLAATAVGRFSSLEKAAAAMVRLRPPLQPQAKHAAAYQTGYARYLELYDCLAPMFAGK